MQLAKCGFWYLAVTISISRHKGDRISWELEFPPQLLEEAGQAFQWFDTQRKLLEQVIISPILDRNNRQLIGISTNVDVGSSFTVSLPVTSTNLEQ